MKSKLTLILFIFYNYSYTQCAMCRAVLESSDDPNIAEDINNGIMYLAFLPYLLVSIKVNNQHINIKSSLSQMHNFIQSQSDKNTLVISDNLKVNYFKK